MFELDRLKEFNPALIYAFEPESVPARLAGSALYQDTIIPEAMQHQDMLDAYLYAQDEILPSLHTQKGNVKPEQLLEWIKTLHGYMAKTLVSAIRYSAGEYTKQSVFRWHYGMMMTDHFIYYFSNKHACKNDKQLASLLAQEFKANEQDLLAFLKILHDVDKKNIAIHPSQEPYIDKSPDLYKGKLLLNKLQTAVNTNLLTDNEKASIEKIVHICLFPCDIPQAMEAYAQKLVAQLAQLNTDNREQLVEFLANSFYELTEIHPFPNGNGRVATCLNNVFLRYFNLPSILLRYPGECNDETSTYSIAVAQINVTREPLKALIHHRINEAQKQAFADEKLKQLISLRVGLSAILQRIHQNHPTFYLNSIEQEISASTLWAARFAEPTDAAILYLNDMIVIAAKKEQQLAVEKTKPNFSLTTLTDEQKKWLVDNLTKITGAEGWKINVRNGIKPWIQFSNEKDAKAVLEVVERLAIGKPKCSRTADQKSWVVLIEDMSYHKINSWVVACEHSAKLSRDALPS